MTPIADKKDAGDLTKQEIGLPGDNRDAMTSLELQLKGY